MQLNRRKCGGYMRCVFRGGVCVWVSVCVCVRNAFMQSAQSAQRVENVPPIERDIRI